MSYIYDPMTGHAKWTPDVSFSTPTHDPYHSVYGSTYGPREEHELLRQQNANRNEQIRNVGLELDSLKLGVDSEHMYSPYSPAGTRPLHRRRFDNSNHPQSVPARVLPLADSQLRDSQRHTDIQERRDGYPYVTGDGCHSRRENIVSYGYYNGLRSKEDLVAELVAKMGLEGYTYLFFARDKIRSRGEPWQSDEELLVEKLAALDRRANSGRSPSRDRLSVPRLRAVLSAEPTIFLEEDDYSRETPSRRLINALDGHYHMHLGWEPGNRFDNVDDDVVTAYVNANDYMREPSEQDFQLIKGREQPYSVFHRWVVPITFLNLQHKFLEVMLPIDQEALADINNDILRVLYIHLSNDSQCILSSISHGSVEESCKCVLSELERRGFTDKLPRAPRLRGLSVFLADRKPRDSDWSYGPSSRSQLSN